MLTLLFAFVLVAAFILCMSVGVCLGRKPIQGSCGGGAGNRCTICGGDPHKCTSSQKDDAATNTPK